jgi:hypothetical protein
VTDVTLADVTDLHGINLCSLPYVSTTGKTTTKYSPDLAASSREVAGTIAISSATSAKANFSSAFNSTPICTITPTSDPATIGNYWVTATASGLTANTHTSGTITFNYVCVGNPN